MNKIEEQLKNVLRTISLSQEERAGMRATLVSEMERAPLPSAPLRQSSSSRVKKNIHKKFMPIALLIALLMSGSVSYAAEGTAPGDTLYPVKIHVNEQVRGALALSEVAKAQLEVKLAEERLKEAEKLAGENRLDATTTQQLKADFSEHRSRADGHIESLKGDDDARASAISLDFSERMRGHHGGREALGITDGDEQGEGSDSESQSGESEGRGRGDSLSGSTTVNSSNTNSTDKSQFNGADPRGEQELRGRGKENETEANTEHSTRVEQGRRGESEDGEGDDEGDDNRGGNTASVVTSTVAPTPVAPTPAPATGGTAVAYTLASIASHNNSASCYSAISGNVYDLTAFIGSHPGGQSTILGLCGKDGTAGFMAQHGGASKPQSVLAGFRLGTLQ